MKPQDFYELKIGQKIYYKTKAMVINSLYGVTEQVLFECHDVYVWNNICQDCSLTPPKKKITKTVERWANIYSDDVICLYESHFDADYHADTQRRISCVKMTGTYEVEE